MHKLKIIGMYLFLSPEKYARKIGVKIGKNCFISTRKFSSEPYLIEIGDGCRIVSNVVFFTHGAVNAQRRRTEYANSKLDIFGKIKIGNYVFIGDSAMIMPGVTIGDNCIVGAGTLVTKSIPENTIVGGNPMRVIGRTDQYMEKAKELSTETFGFSSEKKKKILLSLGEDNFMKKPYIKIETK